MTNRPNILFIMTDQQRFDCIGANGNTAIHTPALDRLSEQSANMRSFYVQSPVCVPSRQTFFSGRYPHSHKNRVNYTSIDRSEVMIQKYLQGEGYKTAFVGKLHYYPQDRVYALSTGFDKGLIHDSDAGPNDPHSDYVKWLNAGTGTGRYINFRECRDDRQNPYTAVIPPELHETTWCGMKTRQMLSDLSKDRTPFFLFSSYWKPHPPFEVPEPWAGMYDDTDILLPPPCDSEYIESLPLPVRTFAKRDTGKYEKIDARTLLWQYRAYYGAISQIDHEVGLTLDKLEKLGLAGNTIVIYCSDHGTLMYEHGIRDKNVFFENAVHVPFMIRYPGKIVPGVYDDLVESTDVLGTIFDLCSIRIPYANEGRSFAGSITNGAYGVKSSPREYVCAENIIPEVINSRHLDFPFIKGEGIRGIRHPDAKMIRSKDWKYNYYPGSGEELFDLKNDPDEMDDLSSLVEYREIKDRMKGALLDWLITADEADQIAPFWFSRRNEKGDWAKDK